MQTQNKAVGFNTMISTKTLLAGFLGFLVAFSCSASGLGPLLVEGHELHASLKTRELKDSFGHLAPDVVPPANPHLSNEARFVEAISRSGSRGRLGSQGIRSALYALYIGDGEPVGEWPRELGFYGLEAASAADANRWEEALREIWAENVRQDRVRIHREGLVLVLVWTYNVSSVSPDCWKAVNAKVAKRLAAPGPWRVE